MPGSDLSSMKIALTFGFVLAGAALAAAPALQEPGTQAPAAGEASQAAPVCPLMPEGGPPEGALPGPVAGRVVFEGERPGMKPLAISAEKAEGCVADGGPVDAADRSLLIGKEGGVRYVVATLEGDGEKLAVPGKPIELDQIQCHYEPHVILVPAGAKVAFKNSDSLSHNVHTYGFKNKGFNKLIAGGESVEQVLAKTESIKVKCDIHPWMSSWIFVTSHVHTAVTGPDGSFHFDGVKPGEYTLKLWHEKLSKGTYKVTIKEDGSMEPAEFKMKAKVRRTHRRS
ncbi:MAG: beta-sandwich domain-containing protein [Planctomycetota bacterium]